MSDNKRVDLEISDFETSPEIKFAILNKLDRIWDIKKESFGYMFINFVTKAEESSLYKEIINSNPDSITNEQFNKMLDWYIDEFKIK